jgi:anti-sigma factor RsiW
MNCQDFQNQMFEYVEGSLSVDTRAVADKHLAGCADCRLALRKEQQIAQSLLDRFQQDTKSLALCPEIRRRVLATPNPRLITGLWHRMAWPLGIAASLLLIVKVLLVHHFPGVPMEDPNAASTVSIDVSYQAPTHKFHKDGNLVLDTVSDQTVAISETLWTTKPLREKQEKKMPL